MGEGSQGREGKDSLWRVRDDTPGFNHGGWACRREEGGVWGVLGECNGGGRGVPGSSRWPVWKAPWKTHLCKAIKESGTLRDPRVSCAIRLWLMPGWVGWGGWVR